MRLRIGAFHFGGGKGREAPMIISRAPFRVSFCGGGSDLPAFYEEHGGCCLSTSIRKYMYLALHRCFHVDRIILKYSKTENVGSRAEIEHAIFRECLEGLGVSGVEITSMADVPAGTGLGSSSAFTVALLKLLHAHRGEYVSDYKLAKEACEVEIERLGEPIGKQDQFASAFGGLRFYEFHPGGFVDAEPVIMRADSYRRLEDSLMLFYIGGTHCASSILRGQAESVTNGGKTQVQLEMCRIARQLRDELQSNNVDAVGEMLHRSWMLKKTLTAGITSPAIDEVYELAMGAGAEGGKLLGAGGAGFMLFYVPEGAKGRVRSALSTLKELEFEMDNSGASIVFVDKDGTD